ncbi:hypothetical protein [Dactylosporangium salmoneum]|uniref:Uncharacterized protein n=1 Tax=Dactylosporangium salmoneum TaxID=53361 RepID=A0ABN3G9S6_9ACTN
MVEAVLHAGGWRVEAVWCDRDGTGERMWHLAADPRGGEYWVTTSQLERLLRRSGLDIGDLTPVTTPTQTVRGSDRCE